MKNIIVDAEVTRRWRGDAILAIFSMKEFKEDSRGAKDRIEIEEKRVINSLIEIGNKVFEESRVKNVRKLFRAMPNMDPTRYRPASEALIRRILNKGFFRINPYVDVNNLLSIQLHLPLGIYDLDLINESSLIYRIGYKNEKYTTISRQLKSAEGKIVLADMKGVIGSPIADSGRASINVNTENLMVIAYFPFETKFEEGNEILKKIDNTFKHVFQPSISNTKLVTL